MSIPEHKAEAIVNAAKAFLEESFDSKRDVDIALTIMPYLIETLQGAAILNLDTGRVLKFPLHTKEFCITLRALALMLEAQIIALSEERENNK